jgi:hypothetical protein
MPKSSTRTTNTDTCVIVAAAPVTMNLNTLSTGKRWSTLRLL